MVIPNKKEQDSKAAGDYISEEEHDFEVIEKPEVESVDDDDLLEEDLLLQAQAQEEEQPKGLWIGIDLGTSNCATAIWDSHRGRPKWMRLKTLTEQQSNGKVGRIVPSAVEIQISKSSKEEDSQAFTAGDPLWQDICKWNEQASAASMTANLQERMAMTVGQRAIESLQKRLLSQDDTNTKNGSVAFIKSMKRVLGVCYSTELKDLDPEFRQSLPFELEETKDGEWVVPLELVIDDNALILYLRPVHVAAILLQAMREAVPVYLQKAIRKKKMKVPGHDNATASTNPLEVNNVVVGVPAYFGQTQRQAVEEAARLAGYSGHVSTLTESTAAAMAYGLFVGQAKSAQKAILVLDMGGGTTDITIAHMKSAAKGKDTPDQKFQVILTDGDSRLGGEDMDQALFDFVIDKATKGESPNLTSQERQRLLRACQQAKELLCGDVDHDEPPAESATVELPSSFPVKSIKLNKSDLDKAIQPLLDQTTLLMKRTLKRYADKISSKGQDNLISEAILIGGATRVPALRKLLKDQFFTEIELCTSVNAMSAVAQGTAIQAAILSKQVPLYELQSAMMLDTTPHAIGVMLPGGSRFVEVLPRDSPLPAQGYVTFHVADLDQKGVSLAVVERIELQDGTEECMYQPLGDFSFLLHRLTESQRKEIEQDGGHRPVDIGMSLSTSGAFQVSIFDPNDPDHQRKKRFYQKAKQDDAYEVGMLDFVQAAADLRSESLTAEEVKLIFVVGLLSVFYVLVKVLLSKDNVLAEEEMARIL